MNTQSIIYVILLFLFSSWANADGSEIRVWTPDFKGPTIIKNQKKIALILEAWSTAEIQKKNSIEPLKHEPLYKIDFKGISKSMDGRWLYSKKGYYRFLSKVPKNTYKIKNTNKLNQQLGI